MDKDSPRRIVLATRSKAEKAKAAAFARAMARDVFERFYFNDRDLAEVQRSLSRAKPPPIRTKP